MKTFVLSMISIAATVAAMTACTSESDPIDDLNPKDDKVEIKLNAGVVNVETKADLNYTGNKTTFGDNVTVQLLRWDTDGNTYVAPTWANVTSNTATISGTSITLQDNQKYYDNTGKNAFFIGFYPTGANATYQEGSVKYTNVDGKMDILCAKAISAGNKTSVSNTNIEFNHMLSQVKITLKGDAVAQSTFGNITSVTLKSIPQNLNLTLGDSPSIAADETNPSAKDILLLSTNETSVPLSTEGTTYSAMIVPSLGASEATKLQIEITTEKNGATPISIDVNDLTTGMQSGTTNNINLTFKDKITVTTSIADWGTATDKNIEYGN